MNVIENKPRRRREALARNVEEKKSVRSTNLLLAIPATAAVTLFTSVARPRMAERSREDRDKLLAEATSQDSGVERRIAVEKPPSRRPTNRIGREENCIRIQVRM